MKKRKRKKSNLYLVDVLSNIFTVDLDEFEPLKKATKKEEDIFWAEKEWTIGKIFMRIFGYGFTLFFLWLGIFMLTESEEGMWVLAIVPLSGCLGMCFTYIKSDIQILKEKKRRRDWGKESNR